MFNFVRNLFIPASTDSNGHEAEPRPIIRHQEVELPLELRFRMQPNRIYRKFPFDSIEAIRANCQFCGGSIHGEMQATCLYCDQDVLPRMIDVTDEPNHLIKPTVPVQPQVVGADAMIPTFGGGIVDLGLKAEAVSAVGDKVSAEYGACIQRLAGNEVTLAGGGEVIVAVAKDRFRAWTGLVCDSEGGITSKVIVLGENCGINGVIVIPENGMLSAGQGSVFDVVYVGAGTQLMLSDKCEIERLVILGPGVKISLGSSCTITDIESDSRFQINAGNNYQNDEQYRLQEDYSLLELINGLVDQALDL